VAQNPAVPPSRLRRWRSRRVVVEDVSMAPALAPGDRLWVDPRVLHGRPPRPGEVVVVPDPGVPSRWLVKRVAATGPARVFVVRSGVVVRTGAGPFEPPADAIEETEVPEGSVFLLSDAGASGRDSRSFGPVAASRILGVAWWRYAPRDRVGPLGPSPTR
jgi:signal peptidase I